MNNNAQQAVIAIQEERARIGGVEVTKKTVIAATDEGLVWLIYYLNMHVWLSHCIFPVIFENICESRAAMGKVLTERFHLSR